MRAAHESSWPRGGWGPSPGEPSAPSAAVAVRLVALAPYQTRRIGRRRRRRAWGVAQAADPDRLTGLSRSFRFARGCESETASRRTCSS